MAKSDVVVVSCFGVVLERSQTCKCVLLEQCSEVPEGVYHKWVCVCVFLGDPQSCWISFFCFSFKIVTREYTQERQTHIPQKGFLARDPSPFG